MPQFSTVQGVCKSPFYVFVLLLHAYSYALDREIFMLRINPIENFFMVFKFFDLRNFVTVDSYNMNERLEHS